jgi:hypothetical protein
MHVYEYLFAGIIIISLIIGSTVMVGTLSTPAMNASDKDQLKITSEKITTQLLLDSGYPYNWGSSQTPLGDLKVFGLAKYGQTSRQAYELDPDKVLRLSSSLSGDSSYYIPPQNALQLLNLKNAYGVAEYGFTIEFSDALLVSAPEQTDDGYTINVRSEYNLPIIGAKVSATLYYIDAENQIAHQGPSHGTTAADGSFLLPFNFNPVTGSSEVLLVAVDYYGVLAVKFFYPTTNTLPATLFGNTVIANQPYSVGGGADCREILLVQTGQGYETRDVSFTIGNSPESSAVAVLAVSSDGGLVVGYRDFSGISYRSIEAVQSAPLAYSLQRAVLIGGSTYTVTIYFWRMTN